MEGGAACEPKLLLRRCSPLLPELELTPPVRADGPASSTSAGEQERVSAVDEDSAEFVKWLVQTPR